MKITIVTGFFLPVPPLRGGSTEKIWYRLAEEFTRLGHVVTIVSRRWPDLPNRETRDGITFIRVPGTDHTSSLARNLLLDVRWGIRVARVLPAADVVICNTVSLPVWLPRLKPSAGHVAVVLGRMPKGQCRFYNGVSLVLATSSLVATRVQAENPRLARRTRVLPNPIDWRRHATAGAARAIDRPLTIGFVGRIHPEKGLHLLLSAAIRLKAMTDLKPWRLQVVGPWTVPEGGGGESYHAELLSRYGTTLGAALELTGPEFDPGKLATRYGQMDIFCYPSQAEKGETFGIAVAEAMAAGCATVVSGLACFRDLVTPSVTGLVFDHTATNADELLAIQLRTLLIDETLRRELGHRAQAHVRKFDYAASAQAVISMLAELDGGHRSEQLPSGIGVASTPTDKR